MKTHYLYPGKIAAFADDTIISTLLGSCVAVALFDASAQVGGLNHFVLPEPPPGDAGGHRYGSDAIRDLIEACIRLGAKKERLKAKIYGGANVIAVSQLGAGIGERNIEAAEKYLKEAGISIIERNVGGEYARTIKLNTTNFDVRHDTTQTQVGADGETAKVDVSGFTTLRTAKNIKVLIVDDSATVRTLFAKIFQASGLEVVGTAVDPYQARDLIVSKKPDVVTLDIEMPKMSGVVFLEKLMKHMPVPVVMVSSLSATGDAALKSLELGAVEFVHKPSQFDPTVLKTLAESLVSKVKAAASVNVLKGLRNSQKSMNSVVADVAKVSTSSVSAFVPKNQIKAILIGGNAGSSNDLERIITSLAQDTPPVVVACSTIAGFANSYISKLKGRSKVNLKVVSNQETLAIGNVYFIPAQVHGKISSGLSGPILNLEKGEPEFSQLPSSSVLFKSAAESLGKNAFSILLGGFGTDGVEGVSAIKAKGGFAVAQFPDEAQFPYAPQKAIELGLVDEILKANEISEYLMNYRNKNIY